MHSLTLFSQTAQPLINTVTDARTMIIFDSYDYCCGDGAYLMKLRCTPRERWMPEQSMHKNTPYGILAQLGFLAAQSKHTCTQTEPPFHVTTLMRLHYGANYIVLQHNNHYDMIFSQLSIQWIPIMTPWSPRWQIQTQCLTIRIARGASQIPSWARKWRNFHEVSIPAIAAMKGCRYTWIKQDKTPSLIMCHLCMTLHLPG